MLWIWSSFFAWLPIHNSCHLQSQNCNLHCFLKPYFQLSSFLYLSSVNQRLLSYRLKHLLLTIRNLLTYFLAGKLLVGSNHVWRKVSSTLEMTSGHSSHVFFSPPAWHLSIISLVGMPGSCHHHHGNVSVLPVAITMAMGVSPCAQCKPLNRDHHGNVCLLKHWAVVFICRSYNDKNEKWKLKRWNKGWFLGLFSAFNTFIWYIFDLISY